MMDSVFPDSPCSCYPEGDCICMQNERALRHISTGASEPMTQAQRDWCKREILSVEGYDERDVDCDDAQLARTVLHAWTDYCRDKGML